MSERALLPGEQEAWDLACDDKRWVVRTINDCWLGGFGLANGYLDAGMATLTSRSACVAVSISSDTIAYRARSVRPDGTPVVP